MRSQPVRTPLTHQRPIPNAYAVPGGVLYAGEYPGTASADSSRVKLTAMLDAGVTAFVDLTGPEDRMTLYLELLQTLATERGVRVTHERLTIPDEDVCSAEQMHLILDAIERRLAEGAVTYLHCWGGVGRTGTVVGCWLVRRGLDGASALREVGALFRSMSPEKTRRHRESGSPQTPAQRRMVESWSRAEATERNDVRAPGGNAQGVRLDVARVDPVGLWRHIAPNADVTPALRDRMRGALIGLAVGDAVGTTVEFKHPGSFSPVTDMVGGGPFGLQPGQWTDDTSMALCLADSLISKREFDAHDQMERYVRWSEDGYLSSTDRCFDIGRTVSAALWEFKKSKKPYSGSTHESTAGNGSLMRLAPIPMFFFRQPDVAITMAADSSRTTHGTAVAVDACRYFAALIVGAIGGATKEQLLSPRYSNLPGYWDEHPLHPTIAAIADGSFKRKSAAEIRGTSYVAESLEAALWAFQQSNDFRTGCLLAVNLGDDADTTAAIFGQLAGAFYGESAIPRDWRERLARKPILDRMAESLFQYAFHSTPIHETRAANNRKELDKVMAHASGDAITAIRMVRGEDAEIGVMASMSGGAMHEQSTYEHFVLLLRIEAGLRMPDMDRPGR